LKRYVYNLHQKGLLDEETPINNHTRLDKTTKIEELSESPIDNKPPDTVTTSFTTRPDISNLLYQDSPLIDLKGLPSAQRSKQPSPQPQKPLEHKGSPDSQTLSSAGKDIFSDGESSFLETTPTEGTVVIPTYEGRYVSP